MIQRTRNKKSKLKRKMAIEGYLFIMPWIIGFVVLVLAPLVTSIVLSFSKFNLVRLSYVGIENYRRILFDDPLFWKSLKITFTFVGCTVVLRLVIALVIALMMNQKIKGILSFRAIYYLPAVVGGAAVGLLWRWVFNPDFGLVNLILLRIGIEGPRWLSSTAWALPAIIIVDLWAIGGTMLIYLAGLQDVPTEVFEAAIVDGANIFSRFVHVTLPMISPVILFNLIMGIIGSFQAFTLAYIMTSGGPNYATYFFAMYIREKALIHGEFGYASTLGVMLLLIILTLTILIFRFSDRFVFYQGRRT